MAGMFGFESAVFIDPVNVDVLVALALVTEPAVTEAFDTQITNSANTE